MGSLAKLNKFLLVPIVTEWLTGAGLFQLAISLPKSYSSAWSELLTSHSKPFVRCIFPEGVAIRLTWKTYDALRKIGLVSGLLMRFVAPTNELLLSARAPCETLMWNSLVYIALDYCSSQAGARFLQLMNHMTCLAQIVLTQWEDTNQMLQVLTQLTLRNNLILLNLRINVKVPDETMCLLFRSNPDLGMVRINLEKDREFHNHPSSQIHVYDRSVYLAAVVHCPKLRMFEVDKKSDHRIFLVHNRLRVRMSRMQTYIVGFGGRPVGWLLGDTSLRITFLRNPPPIESVHHCCPASFQKVLTDAKVSTLEVEGMGRLFQFSFNAINGARLLELTLADDRSDVYESVGTYCVNLRKFHLLQLMSQDKNVFSVVECCKTLTDVFIGNRMTPEGLEVISRCKKLQKLYVVHLDGVDTIKDLCFNNRYLFELRTHFLPFDSLEVMLKCSRVTKLTVMVGVYDDFFESLQEVLAEAYSLPSFRLSWLRLRFKNKESVLHLQEMFPTLRWI